MPNTATEVFGVISCFPAGAALAANRRVKLNSSLQWVYAGATDQWTHVTLNACASGEFPSVRSKFDPGIIKMTGGAARAAGLTCFAAANGKVNATSTGLTVGVLADAINADDDVVGVVLQEAPAPS